MKAKILKYPDTCWDHNTSRMFRIMGLAPACAGLLGSETGVLVLAVGFAISWASGIDVGNVKGFLVNSVARGDINAPSIPPNEGDGVPLPSDSFASI